MAVEEVFTPVVRPPRVIFMKSSMVSRATSTPSAFSSHITQSLGDGPWTNIYSTFMMLHIWQTNRQNVPHRKDEITFESETVVTPSIFKWSPTTLSVQTCLDSGSAILFLSGELHDITSDFLQSIKSYWSFNVKIRLTCIISYSQNQICSNTTFIWLFNNTHLVLPRKQHISQC